MCAVMSTGMGLGWSSIGLASLMNSMTTQMCFSWIGSLTRVKCTAYQWHQCSSRDNMLCLWCLTCTVAGPIKLRKCLWWSVYWLVACLQSYTHAVTDIQH
jgi:hypothetical protein